MKPITLIGALLVFSLSANANESCDEKAEMQRCAGEYRRSAEENKKAALGECELGAPELVKLAALKVVNARHSIGAIEEQLASAYEAGDKAQVQKLYSQKHDAELAYEFSEKEKKVAYVSQQLAELTKAMPESAEVKQLNAKIEADLRQYLENAQKQMEFSKEQARLEKNLESIDFKIEIIKKREELKQLESKASLGG